MKEGLRNAKLLGRTIWGELPNKAAVYAKDLFLKKQIN
jgi:hypothetical protein